jgi:hypothetical protein
LLLKYKAKTTHAQPLSTIEKRTVKPPQPNEEGRSCQKCRRVGMASWSLARKLVPFAHPINNSYLDDYVPLMQLASTCDVLDHR